ncbi:TPA: DUF1329 domain-containing protein [Pseudomonas aeruginosa]|nr:DUF1329 domain-containing protein [Pseudomonas aeruginosa]HCE9552470.1 DUF1329 domain-containing protein [Pseudomonas aeruginosa]
MTIFKGAVVAFALVALTNTTHAAVSETEAAKLGGPLTPLGGEVPGNTAGTIPKWDGGLTQGPAGYVPGKPYLNPFEAEKPLFIIDKSNVEKYRANLTAGQIALLNTYPESFRIPVYQTHRTAASPDWVYANVRKNAVNAKLAAGGNGIEGGYGGVPFPIPQSGVEAIWNHMLRYIGTHVTRTTADIATQQNGSYVPSIIDMNVFSAYNVKGQDASTGGDILFYYVGVAKSPARIAGETYLIHEPINQVADPRKAWVYNPGQRRVRRAPTVAYDTPVGSSDGLRTTDDSDMFNGAPDRYEWKLIGKKEIFIPYNNYKLLDKSLKYKDIIQPGHLNPEFTRYELHRVWEVEATLKSDARHLYSKRKFYIDEDSWSIASVDLYDSRGELWRASMAFLVNYYNVPATLSSVDVFHDLQSRRYQAQGLANEQPGVITFSTTPPDVGDFKPSNLRRFSGR